MKPQRTAIENKHHTANATSSAIHLTSDTTAAFRITNLTTSAAENASTVLQTILEPNDKIFNDQGLHNHILHHILAAYALGADVQKIAQKHVQQLADIRGASTDMSLTVSPASSQDAMLSTVSEMTTKDAAVRKRVTGGLQCDAMTGPMCRLASVTVASILYHQDYIVLLVRS